MVCAVLHKHVGDFAAEVEAKSPFTRGCGDGDVPHLAGSDGDWFMNSSFMAFCNVTLKSVLTYFSGKMKTYWNLSTYTLSIAHASHVRVMWAMTHSQPRFARWLQFSLLPQQLKGAVRRAQSLAWPWASALRSLLQGCLLRSHFLWMLRCLHTVMIVWDTRPKATSLPQKGKRKLQCIKFLLINTLKTIWCHHCHGPLPIYPHLRMEVWIQSHFEDKAAAWWTWAARSVGRPQRSGNAGPFIMHIIRRPGTMKLHGPDVRLSVRPLPRWSLLLLDVAHPAATFLCAVFCSAFLGYYFFYYTPTAWLLFFFIFKLWPHYDRPIYCMHHGRGFVSW